LVSDAVLSANLAVRHQMPRSGDLREDLVMELRNLRSELTSGRLATVLAALIDRAEWEPELDAAKEDIAVVIAAAGLSPPRTEVYDVAFVLSGDGGS